MPFSDMTLAFLAENKLADSKELFEQRRGEYNEFVLEPLRQLVTELAPAMLKIDPSLICEPKVGRSISRIFRDTRFSNDKSIFRDVMWCVFVRTKHESVPGFWFEISPRHAAWGCGWYQTPPAVMEAAREFILAGDRDFKKALTAYGKQSVFRLEDERYKRSRHPDAPEKLREWLDQRSFCFTAETRDTDIIFSPELPQRLAGDFALLKPEYDFLLKALSRVKKD